MINPLYIKCKNQFQVDCITISHYKKWEVHTVINSIIITYHPNLKMHVFFKLQMLFKFKRKTREVVYLYVDQIHSIFLPITLNLFVIWKFIQQTN